MTTFTALAVITLAVLASFAAAAHTVTLYEHINYHGEQLTLQVPLFECVDFPNAWLHRVSAMKWSGFHAKPGDVYGIVLFEGRGCRGRAHRRWLSTDHFPNNLRRVRFNDKGASMSVIVGSETDLKGW